MPYFPDGIIKEAGIVKLFILNSFLKHPKATEIVIKELACLHFLYLQMKFNHSELLRQGFQRMSLLVPDTAMHKRQYPTPMTACSKLTCQVQITNATVGDRGLQPPRKMTSQPGYPRILCSTNFNWKHKSIYLIHASLADRTDSFTRTEDRFFFPLYDRHPSVLPTQDQLPFFWQGIVDLLLESHTLSFMSMQLQWDGLSPMPGMVM